MTGLRAGTLPHGTVSTGRDPLRQEDHMIKEFRDFLFRGNIIDLAVAVVLGAAFGAIVTSLVEDILTPLLGLLGIPDFSTLTIQVGDAEMRIGAFLNTLISFVLIAAAIFFVVVKPYQRIAAMRATTEDEAAPTEIDLLTQIRDELRRGSAPEV
jgi:large conductance mechanosensitive channel